MTHAVEHLRNAAKLAGTLDAGSSVAKPLLVVVVIALVSQGATHSGHNLTCLAIVGSNVATAFVFIAFRAPTKHIKPLAFFAMFGSNVAKPFVFAMLALAGRSHGSRPVARRACRYISH